MSVNGQSLWHPSKSLCYEARVGAQTLITPGRRPNKLTRDENTVKGGGLALEDSQGGHYVGGLQAASQSQ